MELWVVWLVAAGVLLVVEMLTLTFYLLWFGIGAAAGALVALFYPDSLAAQLLVGSIVALVLTVFTKRLTKRYRGGKGYRDAVEELVGKEGVVVEPAAPGKAGIVKVGTETWSAIAEEPLGVAEIVEVVRRGTTFLHVRKKGG